MSSLMLALISSRAWVKWRGARVRLLLSGFICWDEGVFADSDSTSSDGGGSVNSSVVVEDGKFVDGDDVAFSTSSRTHDKAAATARFLRSEPE